MKKVLFLVVLMVLCGAIALAAGTWHYCDLCGREHSGVICPEACQNDCSTTTTHKWYECPEYVHTACWYCGDDSGSHNENCCPSGEIVWNDIKGTFRAGEYSYEEGVRIAEYCSFCQHYGYHYSAECIKNPVRVTPAPVVPTAVPTAEPTAEPTAMPTVIPTIEPTAVPTEVPVVTECRHGNTTTCKGFVSNLEKASGYCGGKLYMVQTICKDCEEIVESELKEEGQSHVMNNGICVNCGYTTNDANTVPSGSSCSHPVSEVVLRRVDDVNWYKADGDVCLKQFNAIPVCDLCAEDVGPVGIYSIPYGHVEGNGACRYCGKVMHTVEPTTRPTEVPEFNPTEAPQFNKPINGNTSDWFPPFWAFIAFAVIVFLIFMANRYLNRTEGTTSDSEEDSEENSAEEEQEEEMPEENSVEEEQEETPEEEDSEESGVIEPDEINDSDGNRVY